MIIGISGKIGSGKDTAVGFILEKYPQFKTKTFAHNLKLIVSIITSTTIEENYSRKGKSTIPPGFDKTLGQYQQIIGEGLRKLVKDDIWIQSALGIGSIDVGKINNQKYLLITDVRYKNEAKAIESAGGFIIRINRSCNKSFNEDERVDKRDHAHSSEVDLDDYEFKHTIANDGTLEDLKNNLYEIIDMKMSYCVL